MPAGSPAGLFLMRHLEYASGLICKTAGLLLLATATILWLRGRPGSGNLFVAGLLIFFTGVYLKRRSFLKTCPNCRAKSDRSSARCSVCGADLPANPLEELSQPFYK